MKLDDSQKKALENALKDIAGEAYVFTPKNTDESGILIFTKSDPLEVSKEVAKQFFLYSEEELNVVVMDQDNLSNEQQSFLNNTKREPLK